MAKITIIDGNDEIELSTAPKENIKAYMVKGEPGTDGISPTASVSKTGDVATLTVTDRNGTTEADVIDGFNPTITTSKTNKTTTLTITDIDGTRTAEILDGIDLTGGVPTNGVIGFDTDELIYTCDGTETGSCYLTYDGVDFSFTMPVVEDGDVLVFNTSTLTLTLDGTTITTQPLPGTGTELTFDYDIPGGYVITDEPFPGAETSGGGIIALKTITTAPSTFVKDDKYYNSTDDLIYTATSSSAWNNGETPDATSLYLNEADNKLYRYYDNTMNLAEGGGEVLPVGSEIDYDGTTVPTGWEEIEYPNIITTYRTTDYSLTTTNNYEKIPFDAYESIGSKLTLNSSGEIVIGAGVTNIKTSAKITLVGASLTAGNKNLVIMKNGTTVDRIWARIDAYNSYMAMPSRVISVNEGDVITLAFYGTLNDKISGTSPFSQMTVEVVE